MQVDWKNFLKALDTHPTDTTDALQPCPLHPIGEPTLRVHKDPLTDHWHFTCLQPRCQFSGDAVMLASRFYNAPIEVALDAFKPGGALHTTLTTTLLANQVEEYLRSRSNQLYIAEYLNLCQQALQSDSAYMLRTRLATFEAQASGLSGELIPGLGVLLGNKIPDALREFNKRKYANIQSYHAVYPYTFDGTYTCIRAQNFSDPTLPRTTVPIWRGDLGIFMESNIRDSSTEVLVTGSELTACIVYNKTYTWSVNPLPVVALMGLPLPCKYRHIQTLALLSFADEPLELEDALEYYAAPTVVEASPEQPELVVKQYPFRLTGTPNPIVHNSLQQQGVKLDQWIVTKIAALLEDNRGDEVYKAFDHVNISAPQRQHLYDRAVALKVTTGVTQLLQNLQTATAQRFILGDGTIVRRTATGMQIVRQNKEIVPISNVVVDVVGRIVAADGIEYVCKFQSPDAEQIVTGRLTAQDTPNRGNLQRIASRAFLEAGVSVYVAFYRAGGEDYWGDILAKLAEGKPITRELNQLGLDDDLQIHFPNIILDTVKKVIKPQNHILTFPEYMNRAYRGLNSVPHQDPRAPLHQLVQMAHDNVYLTGLLAGLCHILGQLRKSLLMTDNGIFNFTPQHMLYVATELDTWLPVLHQLAHIVNGTPEYPLVSNRRLSDQYKQVTAMGNLPWIAGLTGFSAKQVPGVVDGCPASLISCIDQSTAGALSGNSSHAFVTIDDLRNQDVVQLHIDSLIEIQQALPALLLETLTTPRYGHELYDYSIQPMLAVQGYALLCRVLGIPADEHMLRFIKPCYNTDNFADCHMFMDHLHMIINRYSVVRQTLGIPTADQLKNSSSPDLCIDASIVLLSKRLITLVNKRGQVFAPFHEAELTRDFEKRGYLRDLPSHVSSKYYWALDKSIWSKYIKKEPILLPGTVSGNVIRLTRIA